MDDNTAVILLAAIGAATWLLTLWIRTRRRR